MTRCDWHGCRALVEHDEQHDGGAVLCPGHERVRECLLAGLLTRVSSTAIEDD